MCIMGAGLVHGRWVAESGRAGTRRWRWVVPWPRGESCRTRRPGRGWTCGWRRYGSTPRRAIAGAGVARVLSYPVPPTPLGCLGAGGPTGRGEGLLWCWKMAGMAHGGVADVAAESMLCPAMGCWGAGTASRTASRFVFCQPISDPFGPVRIAVLCNKDGVFCVLGAGPNGLRITLWAVQPRPDASRSSFFLGNSRIPDPDASRNRIRVRSVGCQIGCQISDAAKRESRQ